MAHDIVIRGGQVVDGTGSEPVPGDLAIDAGVDFPWLLYQMASGAIPDPVPKYRIGVRLRWLLGDLDSLYLTLRDRNYSMKAKLVSILQFLTPASLRTRHEVNRWSDMRPFWCELNQYIKDIFR